MIFIFLIFLSYMLLWVEKEAVRVYGVGYRGYSYIISNKLNAPEKYRVLIPWLLHYVLRFKNNDFIIAVGTGKEILIEEGKSFKYYYLLKWAVIYFIFLLFYFYLLYFNLSPVLGIFILFALMSITFHADSLSSLTEMLMFGLFFNSMFYCWPIWIAFLIVAISALNRESYLFMPLLYYFITHNFIFALLLFIIGIATSLIPIKIYGIDKTRINTFFNLKRRYKDLRNTYIGCNDMLGKHNKEILYNPSNVGYIVVVLYIIAMMCCPYYNTPLLAISYIMLVMLFFLLIAANIWENRVFYPIFYALVPMWILILQQVI
jgi:hypothetical protein